MLSISEFAILVGHDRAALFVEEKFFFHENRLGVWEIQTLVLKLLQFSRKLIKEYDRVYETCSKLEREDVDLWYVPGTLAARYTFFVAELIYKLQL